MKIQILKSKNGQFYWRIVARNGRILATSETYKSKQACKRTVDAFHADSFWNDMIIQDLTN